MSTAQVETILRGLPGFNQLTTDIIRLLAFSGNSQLFGPGQYIYKAGQRLDGGYLVISGTVECILPTNSNQESQLMLQQVGEGNMLGWVNLISESKAYHSARALGKVHVHKIENGVFKRMLNEYPQTSKIFYKLVLESVNSVNASLMRADDYIAKRQSN